MKRETVEKLQSDIDAIMEQGEPDSNLLSKCKDCINLSLAGIKDLKSQIVTEGFSDESEEIRFYKEDAPRVWGLYIYYNRLVEIEVWRKTRSAEKFRELLRAKLYEAELFPEKHSICEYYYQDRTDLDRLYFTRQTIPEDGQMGVFLDNGFTIGAYWLSHMRANEALRSWIHRQLAAEHSADQESGKIKKLTCYAKPVEIVEVFKAFHLKNWFGKASFKEVMSWVRETLDVNTSNYNITLQEIQRRKMGQTRCLDDARDKFMEWITQKP
ncbi:MAG TPA: RteC domain-containing protein [Puia sp.]|nr:RteC domain-containing protein [Puia sp.]